jgi:hypothetical protein
MGLVLGVGLGWGANQLGWTEPIEHRLWGAVVPAPVEVLPDSVVGRMSLFVMAGQSNMSGRGRLDARARTPVAGAYLFGNDYRWHPAREPTDDTTRQVDLVSRDAVVGVSPGRAFATAIREAHPGRPVGLIPCAKGGSSIAQWQPSFRETTLYGSCLKRIRAAGVVGDVACILFFQGETDALTPAEAPGPVAGSEWAYAFERLVRAWRRDLQRPDLPVVFAQIGSLGADSSRFAGWRAVQESQRRVSLPHTRMIETKGLPLQDDLHYTTGAYRTIGRRFAGAWLDLTSEASAGRVTRSQESGRGRSARSASAP